MKRSYIKRQSNKNKRQGVEERRLERDLAELCYGKCEFPGCPSNCVEKHEIIFRSQGGSATDPFNVILLCIHHHRAQHSLEHEPPMDKQLLLTHIHSIRVNQAFEEGD